MPAVPAVVTGEAVETQVVDENVMETAAAYHSQKAQAEQMLTDSQPPPGYFDPVEKEKVLNTIPEDPKARVT